jgi:hypothetical protein
MQWHNNLMLTALEFSSIRSAAKILRYLGVLLPPNLTRSIFDIFEVHLVEKSIDLGVFLPKLIREPMLIDGMGFELAQIFPDALGIRHLIDLACKQELREKILWIRKSTQLIGLLYYVSLCNDKGALETFLKDRRMHPWWPKLRQGLPFNKENRIERWQHKSNLKSAFSKVYIDLQSTSLGSRALR